jgi:hypothetical protein
MNKTILVVEVVANLNKLVEPMQGRKIKAFENDLHQPIIDLIKDYCESLGLKATLWAISTGDYMNVGINGRDTRFGDLIKYQIPNFKEDKRVKFGKAGTIDKVVFQAVHPEYATDKTTLQQYITNLRIAWREAKINNLLDNNSVLCKSLTESNTAIKDLVDEINSIKLNP